MQLVVVGKYFKVIYLPILAVGFIHPGVRNLSVNVYLGSILLTCIISIIKSRFFIAGDAGAVFYNHIITGFMVAFGSYLAGLFAFQNKGWLRIFYLSLVVLTSYQVLFINTGRTGYIVYFILMVLLLLQKISFKKSVPGIMLLCGMMLAVYYTSPVLQFRVNDLLGDIKIIHQNNKENTSLGFRVQFHKYAKSLFTTHPFIGIGTGGFKYRISKDNPVPGWGTKLTDPHSQYWLTLSEQGVIGLLFLLFFLGSLFITSFQLTETRPILLGVLAAFSSSAFADTILCYSTAGFMLVFMSALSLGELIEKRVLFVKGKEFSSSTAYFISATDVG
ncbi:O-antigen ligase family protein [Legionella antarctica]|nr:O-antigen ligase family protein [Legionella antarctica]